VTDIIIISEPNKYNLKAQFVDTINSGIKPQSGESSDRLDVHDAPTPLESWSFWPTATMYVTGLALL
jgi:hypothetical protein